MKATQKDIRFLLYGSLVSFGTYFCMYAFRKPFAVATFEGLSVSGIDYKIVLIIAQVLGYMLAKFIGIKLISELKAKKRFLYLVSMILIAELSLVLFAMVSLPYNFIFLFLNGLSLGMVWGIVFSYIEGRKFTEILSIALCSSFILSSGVVKSVGLVVMTQMKVTEFWMPAVTGALFLAPFIACAWFLNKIPAPSAEDHALRKERKPMTHQERKMVLKRFMFPIVILVFFYMGLTALRDFRDNFSREIWDAVGFVGNASVFTLSEIPVAFLVLCIIGAMGFIKNNQKAFMAYHYVLIFGSCMVGLGTLLFQMELISALLWMIAVGFGLYICYVPFNGVFFDRMIATFRIHGNAGYLIYIADAFGYLASTGVLLYKNFGQGQLSWLQFFSFGTYAIAILGCIISVISMLHFKGKYKKENPVLEPSMPVVKL